MNCFVQLPGLEPEKSKLLCFFPDPKENFIFRSDSGEREI
jgi:hypothetical protein